MSFVSERHRPPLAEHLKFTYDDFLQFPDDGKRHELIDGEHYVMKGASPARARELVRPTFRNWFRARYPYVYATFRCVRPAAGSGR